MPVSQTATRLRRLGETRSCPGGQRSVRPGTEADLESAARPGRIGSVLAGRVAELCELHGAAVRAAAERRGWVGLVGGEPGIGKTRLVAACAARLGQDGFGCAWVSCPEDDGAPPFWVWGRLLDQLGVSGVLRPGPNEADPGLARFLLFEAVAAGVREAAAKGPLPLVVDDLHWADPGSRRLLAAIRGALATLPVVALGTYRDTEPGAVALCAEVGPERHVVLGGLARGELAAAVCMATGSAVPDALLEELHARTAGNPYFAAETVRLLRAEGRLDASAQLPGELLPPTVPAARSAAGTGCRAVAGGRAARRRARSTAARGGGGGAAGGRGVRAGGGPGGPGGQPRPVRAPAGPGGIGCPARARRSVALARPGRRAARPAIPGGHSRPGCPRPAPAGRRRAGRGGRAGRGVRPAGGGGCGAQGWL